MKRFYGRELELGVLNDLYNKVETKAQMTVITGRRRLGKTVLSLEHSKNKDSLYLFVSKKSEILLCEEFTALIEQQFNVPVLGKITQFKDVFELVLQLAQKQKIVLVVDEFQEFFNINPAVYSELQYLWDMYKHKSKIHLIFIGSVYSLMNKIFQGSKEPLFGRADRMIYLKPFKPDVLKNILKDARQYSCENLFYNYVITGGVPRYQELLFDNGCFSKNEIMDFIFQKDSPFLLEGQNLLISEFGKEYGTYFSILELLSEGKTARSEIESIMNKNAGGFLDRLEKDYDVIEKYKPIGAKSGSKNQKYRIKDNFLRFWFRFVYKYRSVIETENFTYIKRILKRDFSTFCGFALERLFYDMVCMSGDYNLIGSYWERGNLNELDLVAVNDLDKTVLIGECKLNAKKISLSEVEFKAKKLKEMYEGYAFSFKGFSTEAIDDWI